MTNNMQHYTYPTHGTCSVQIDFDIDDQDRIHNVQYLGGCDGNLQGIGRLVEGMPAAEVRDRLKGIRCGWKDTSCPDQLAQALTEIMK